MLLAVEGGGFFSSSASGYSKGLTLLFLGSKKEEEEEEKPMRVAPWNQYQLVDQETNRDIIQLAPRKNRLVRGCTSYVCFRRADVGLDSSTSPLKVGPTEQQQEQVSVDVPALVLVSDDDNNNTQIEDETSTRKIDIKSSLRKKRNDSAQIQRRKVQWTDMSGGDLVEIREFEPSDDDDDSDDEFHNGSEKSCACTIM